MDLVSDALCDGRRFRLPPMRDHFTHECLEIVVDQSVRADASYWDATGYPGVEEQCPLKP